MPRSRSPRRRLCVEVMEDRLTPTTGIPWLDPGSLTLSFVPDGTDSSGSPSSLDSLLGAVQPAGWQREVLRAFQMWAAQADLNIGLVADGGQPMGVAGAPQGDPRFGDIRVAARPLSTTEDGSIAGATGFEVGGGTWSGDVVLNTAYQFAVGNPTGQQFDLYSVALHEAGHALGLKHNTTDSTAVMAEGYSLHTGLTTADVSAIQGLYGPRVNDAYEGLTGNDSFASAYDLSRDGQLTGLSADITRAGDVDVYQFTTPDAASGATALTVNLRAAGISLLTARVSVYDANFNPVGTAVAADPLANDLSIPLAGYQPSTTYYVRVEGAGADVFSVGAYVLRLDYNVPVGTSDIKLGPPPVDYETQANETTDTATPLTQLARLNTPTFVVGGYLGTVDTDWYQITPQWPSTAAGTLTVSVWPATQNGVMPIVRVYDSLGSPLAAEVVANEKSGTYTIQIPNQQAGQTYYLQVRAADPSGSRATGTYVLMANLTSAGPIQFDGLAGDTLSASKSVAYSKMDVTESRLTEFTLTADTGRSGVDAAVRMTIFDAQGHAVFTMVALAGQTVTGNVWLPAGTYTVAFNAATRSGAQIPSLAFGWSKRERSNPLDPILVDTTSSPTDTAITTTTPTYDPTGYTIVDAISNPFAGI